MKITDTFEVARDIDSVWALFQDVPNLALCLPGAELTEDLGDSRYKGTVEVKLGPIAVSFEGEATVEPDEAGRRGIVKGTGSDRRGGSRAQMKIDYSMEATDSGTRVTVDADIVLSGPAAQFGRVGLIKEITSRIIEQFVACIEAKLAAETPEEAAEVHAAEVKGLSLFLASLFAPVVRFFKRIFGGSRK